MTKEQLETIKSILSVLDLCILKDATSIASCVALTNKLKEFSRVVLDLENSLNKPAIPPAELTIVQEKEVIQRKERKKKAKTETVE